MTRVKLWELLWDVQSENEAIGKKVYFALLDYMSDLFTIVSHKKAVDLKLHQLESHHYK